MPPLIDIKNLRYAYPDGAVALDGVDFTLAAGETVAVLGPNGSGKTTFVLHLNGLLMGEGEVVICGLPVGKNTLPEIRRKVGVVFQDPSEQLFMPTVLEDVAFGPLNLGKKPAEAMQAAEHYLDLVGMKGVMHKAPYHLSEGEKRRVSLAGVLVMDPEILVLDEPTTFLDPPGHRELVGLLRRLPQAKVIVTHQSSLAASLAGRAVFFQKGRIVDQGPVPTLIARHNWSLAD